MSACCCICELGNRLGIHVLSGLLVVVDAWGACTVGGHGQAVDPTCRGATSQVAPPQQVAYLAVDNAANWLAEYTYSWCWSGPGTVVLRIHATFVLIYLLPNLAYHSPHGYLVFSRGYVKPGTCQACTCTQGTQKSTNHLVACLTSISQASLPGIAQTPYSCFNTSRFCCPLQGLHHRPCICAETRVFCICICIFFSSPAAVLAPQVATPIPRSFTTPLRFFDNDTSCSTWPTHPFSRRLLPSETIIIISSRYARRIDPPPSQGHQHSRLRNRARYRYGYGPLVASFFRLDSHHSSPRPQPPLRSDVIYSPYPSGEPT